MTPTPTPNTSTTATTTTTTTSAAAEERCAALEGAAAAHASALLAQSEAATAEREKAVGEVRAHCDSVMAALDSDVERLRGVISERDEALGVAASYTASLENAAAEAERLLASVRAQIDELVRNDPHRPYDMSSVTYYQDLMIEFIETRADKLPEWVGPRPE